MPACAATVPGTAARQRGERARVALGVGRTVQHRADAPDDGVDSADVVEVEVGEHQQVDARRRPTRDEAGGSGSGSGPVSTSATAPSERSEHGVALADVAREHAPSRRQRPSARDRREQRAPPGDHADDDRERATTDAAPRASRARARPARAHAR